jgi:hypothetical protein
MSVQPLTPDEALDLVARWMGLRLSLLVAEAVPRFPMKSADQLHQTIEARRLRRELVEAEAELRAAGLGG